MRRALKSRWISRRQGERGSHLVKQTDKAIAAINQGTKRSTGVRVSASPAAIEPGLKTFTIIDWTSSSRQIANP
jgi:hypothetical protein